MSNKLIIHGSVLGELGKRFNTKSDISPLHLQEQYNEIGPSKLRESGVANEEMVLVDPELDNMIQALASPSYFSRFRYTEGVSVKETTVYYNLEGELICGMTTGMDEVVTLDPNIDIGDEMDQVMQLIGHSVIQYNDFDQDLTVNESVALAAMIDLYRKHMYESLGLSRNFDPELNRCEDVLREINNEKAQWIMWLTFIIRQSVGAGKTFELEDIEKALASLVEKNLLIQDGLKYKITKDVEELAIRMHMTDNIIVANCGVAIEDQVHVMSFISAQFGLKDLLLIDGSGEQVSLVSVSASQVMKILMDFMYSPMAFFSDEVKAIKESVKAVVQEEAVVESVEPTVVANDAASEEAQAFKFCVHCGNKINADAAFCSNCGQKV